MGKASATARFEALFYIYVLSMSLLLKAADIGTRCYCYYFFEQRKHRGLEPVKISRFF